MDNLKKILVTTDFSKTSLDGVDRARDLAAESGAALTLLNVVPVPDPEWIGVAAYGVPEVESRFVENAKKAMNDLIATRFEGVDGVNGVVERGPVAEVVATYVEEHDIDLLVVSSHGHTGVKRWLLGSVAERLIRRVPCSTLIVKGKAADASEDAAAEGAGRG